MDLLVKNQFSDAADRFDATMKAALPAEKLGQVWGSLLGDFGPFQSMAGSRSEMQDAFEIVYVTCRFEKASLDGKVVFDREQRIAGLYFVPSQAPSSAADAWTAPPYARKDAFEEKEIAIGTGEWQLPATLTLPLGPGPFPAVVLVHGSGPQDRDETIGPNKPFRDLAWGLASRGIAAVRYEKRSKVHGEKLLRVRDLTVRHEVLDDAIAAVGVARKAAGIDARRVFVLGHSLGGYLAPRILRGDPSVAGAIVLAGSARPLQVLILEQMTTISQLDGTVSKEEAAKLEEVRAELAKLEDPSFSAASPPVFSAPASYWIDLRKYEPVAMAKALARPMLILQGGRDYQVTRSDFDLWMQGLEGRKDCTFRLYPDLNHLFIAGTGKSSPEEYSVPGHVAAAVVDDVAAWISGLPSPR